MFRSIGQVVLPLALLALIAVGQWGVDVRAERDAAPAVALDSTESVAVELPHEAEFLPNAFPPVIPDTEWHQEAWLRDDCLRCHETGVGEAPQIVHEGMAPILLKAKCRSCHVFIEGTPAPPQEEKASRFDANAFPPMIPASGSHRTAWVKDDCLLCHESGNSGAPVVVHDGMPDLLLQAKCRSCHVQIRSDEASRNW